MKWSFTSPNLSRKVKIRRNPVLDVLGRLIKKSALGPLPTLMAITIFADDNDSAFNYILSDFLIIQRIYASFNADRAMKR